MSYQANPVSLLQEEYKFTYPKRGVAVIINNRNFDQEKTGQMDRDGTDVDASALESTFIRMGFDVCRYDNLNSLDMMLTFRRCKLLSSCFKRKLKKYTGQYMGKKPIIQ